MCRNVLFLVFATALLCPTLPCSAADGEKTWEGTWNNRKYGTSGPLKCVASETKPGQWSGVFTGTFQGDPFEYKATFESKKSRGDQQNLSGKATIRGHKYQWTGVMAQGGLRGKYNSSVGYHGEFVLKEKRR